MIAQIEGKLVSLGADSGVVQVGSVCYEVLLPGYAISALADRIGPRPQMILGPTIVAIGMALLAIGGSDAGYVRNFLPGLVLFGLGMALAIAPLTKSALAVDPQLSGAASGFNNSVSRIAALLAIAALGAIVLSTFSARLSDTLDSSDLTQENREQILAQSDKLGGIDIPDNFDRNAQETAALAIRESFVYGFRWAMVLCAVLALSGAFISFFSIHGPPQSRSPDSNNSRT